MLRRTPWYLLCTILLCLFVFTATASAAGNTFVPTIQTWALILGAITPLFTYALNHFAPWVDEATKGIVLAVVAGVVGAIYTALETNQFGFNNTTVQLILTAIFGAFGAHLLVWRPTTISARLGGGSNAKTPPAA